MYTNTCKFCGTTFESIYPHGNVCKDCKVGECIVCGKVFNKDWPYDQKTCSSECRKEYMRTRDYTELNARRAKNLLEKYGVDSVMKVPEFVERSKAAKKPGYIKPAPPPREPLIRICKLCGQEFEAYGSQEICTRDHYRTCEACGKLFKMPNMTRKTCSEKCYHDLIKKHMRTEIHNCAYCGKEFETTWVADKYCPGPHTKICPICGTEFNIDKYLPCGTGGIPNTCGNIECVQKFTEQTCLKVYGVPRASMTEEARANAGEKSREMAEQRKQTCLARYGVEYSAQADFVRRKISETIGSSEWQQATRQKMIERYGAPTTMQSRELMMKRNSKQFKNYAEDGTRLDSKWEVAFYEFLTRNHIQFSAQIPIEFEHEGTMHKTFVDFQVDDLLFEVKGSHLLEGIFDTGQLVPIEKKLEIYKKHHVIIITDSGSAKLFGKPNSATSNGLKYSDKCPEPLIGVDISLFMDPKFPFAPDRPTCFYKVKVDGEMSCYEAFFDEQIRWEMILNRIMYAGGFIDSKQVLTAMNVTRTCKQPSWFSAKFAADMLNKYATSKVIVDPFAGWGGRYEACARMGLQYIGSDYNPELVAWHTACGRTIKLADANDVKYDGECTVFICPPYSDPKTGRCFEDYNFTGFDESAKALSQCDWLKIVMRNVPNAKEYIMVCKIVDPDFEQYVVEEKVNKSHFGTNKEYVLVIKNEDRYRMLI